MKKIIISLFTVFACVTISNAQLLIGGNFNISKDGGNVKTTPSGGSTSTAKDKVISSFGLNPKIGVFLGNKIAVGAELNFLTASTNDKDNEILDYTYCVGMAPFVRYYAINSGKFSVFAEGKLGILREADINVTSGTTTKGDKRISKYFDVKPAIAYGLTDKIQIEANINCVKFNFTQKTTKTENNLGDEVKDTNNSFDLGLDAGNIFTSGFITLGIMFKL